MIRLLSESVYTLKQVRSLVIDTLGPKGGLQSVCGLFWAGRDMNVNGLNRDGNNKALDQTLAKHDL